MIAAASTTPTRSPARPGTLAGGEQAPTAAANGDEQPTFDHVLAREARSEARIATPRRADDGVGEKTHGSRRMDQHKDRGSATGPPSPDLFIQGPATPESRPTAGETATAPNATGSALNGAASGKGTPEDTIGSRASADQMPATTVDSLRSLQATTSLPANREGQQGDLKPILAAGTIPDAGSPDSSSASLAMKTGDTMGDNNGDRQVAHDALVIATQAGLADSFGHITKSPLTYNDETTISETPPREPSPRAVTGRAETSLGQIGSVPLRAPMIATRTELDVPRATTFSAHSPAASAATTASRPVILPTSRTTSEDGKPATDLLSAVRASKPAGPTTTPTPIVRAAMTRPPNNQQAADWNAAPIVQAAIPRIEPDERSDRPRGGTAPADVKEQEPTKPAANQPAWLLNPLVTFNQSPVPARGNRVGPGRSVAPFAVTSAPTDRTHHTGQTDSAPTGNEGTSGNVTGMPVGQAGPSYAQAAGGPPTHGSGTDPGTTVYQPIAQRVLVHGASLQVAGAASSFNVVLNPRSLGMVTVHVARGREGLQVTITPQQSDTTVLLNKHLPDLVGMLKQGGQDLPVQAQVVQTHGTAPAHSGTPQAAGAGQSGLNTSTGSGGQAFTGQPGNSEQGAWAAAANDLFGGADHGTGESGPMSPAARTLHAGAARVDLQA